MADFERFESLSPREAQALLAGFLETEARAVEQTLAEALRQGLGTDYSIGSLSPIMCWALDQITTVRMLPDPALPAWITQTESYRRGLFDFDEPSAFIVLRVAYYMGECFVRSFPGLSWSVGDAETAEKNMPVVSGFDHQMELAPMLIAENLFRRVRSGMAGKDAFDIAVQRWADLAVRKQLP
jgi:hypothetical protein